MIRLFVDHALAEGEEAPLSRDQAHYLSGVMRRGPGDRLRVFDGRSGEFDAEIVQASKRGGSLRIHAKTQPLRRPPDLWLLFAPIKKARTDFIVEKAAELGAARICPVQTSFTNAERVRRDRLQAHVQEAVEQCGGTFVPEVTEAQRLTQVLDGWPKDRRLMFCDEALAVSGTAEGAPPPLFAPQGDATAKADPGPWAILIGPEGGFSDAERDRLHAMPQATPVRLGPRILRADTAVAAAMTLWQISLGDWA